MKRVSILLLFLFTILFSASCANDGYNTLDNAFNNNSITSLSHLFSKSKDDVASFLSYSTYQVKDNWKYKRFPGIDLSIKHEGEGWELYSQGQNFELYSKTDKTNTYYSYYYIFDKDHHIVEEGGYDFGTHDLSIEQTNDDVVWMHSWTGIGPGTRWSRYYSVSRNEFSDVFWDVFDQYGEVIVYETNHKTLVVRDIFDEQAYFIELSEFSKPLCDNPAPFQGAKFLNDGKSLEVTYMAEEDDSAYGFIMYTETIDLP